MHLALEVEYDGTEFSGWQVQPGRRTVQGEIEDALQRFRGGAPRVAAAGRTDAGVHASGQIVSFRCDRDFEPRAVRSALNALTGDDLAVRSVCSVSADFDPRRWARRRTYCYRLWNRRAASPFWRRYAWHVPRELDAEAMRCAAAALLGEHDFTSFRAAGCDAAHPVRRVFASEIVARQGAPILYRVAATAFLRHMVRNIVGTLVEVGHGARSSADVERLLELRKREQAGPTAPAHGLCLTQVEYAEDVVLWSGAAER